MAVPRLRVRETPARAGPANPELLLGDMVPRTRTPRGPDRRAGAPSRLGSLRTVLLVLAVVPSLALVLLWAISSDRLFSDWQTQSAQDDLALRAGVPASRLYFALQDERLATAHDLAGDGSARKVAAARTATDRAARGLIAVGATDTAAAAQLHGAVARTGTDLQQLGGMRLAADHHAVSQADAFIYYTKLLGDDLQVFETLGRADNGAVAYAAGNLNDLFAAGEMLSREEAALARPTLDPAARRQLTGWIGAQRYLFGSRVAPYLPATDAATLRRLTTGTDWRTKTTAEDALLAAPAGAGPLATPGRDHWTTATAAVEPGLRHLLAKRTNDVGTIADDTLDGLEERLLLIALVGLAATALVVVTTVRLTGSLRRRIFALRDEALVLQQKLPGMVERLRAGETVDAEAEFGGYAHGEDELGQLGEALDTARRTAVDTAVQQAEQQRGFERLLQRIARRTQLLIGLQLKKLDQLERRHEDPAVLEGLFDLDHLTARLRRYEESLVILGGGQPQRRWRRPVPLLDVLRAAQGEVQDYRRIRIEVEDRPWISERAVGPLVHMLAELMENGAAFSRATMPVEVRAAVVDRGVTVEIEDRGLGMEPEQYRSANAMMAEPPQTDVLSHAEDIRLGLFVVARLAGGLGAGVELRPSAFGGTRVIVYIPSDLVVDAPGADPCEAGAAASGGPEPSPVVGISRGLPARARGRAMAQVTPATVRPGTRPAGTPLPADPDAGPVARPAPPTDTPPDDALPRRVRQASLAAGLRGESANPLPDAEPEGSRTSPGLPRPRRSGAAIGAFQRQSRLARGGPETQQNDATGGTGDESDRTTPTTRDPE